MSGHEKLTALVCVLCMTMALAVPASALEYTIDAPNGPEYAKPTSVEPVYTADRGEKPNEDLSKNTALIPPTFGSATSYELGVGSLLAPGLIGANTAIAGTIINGSTAPVVFPGAPLPEAQAPAVSTGASIVITEPTVPAYDFTEVSSGLYYSKGYLGMLEIPSIDVNVKVYQGTDSSTLSKGAGHFEDTSIWDGNVCIAGHNRGANCYFGNIHTLNLGDKITLTTKLGTRTYQVTSVNKISETDNSLLAPATENCITLITCVRGQSAYRWAVRAVEK